MGDRCPRPVQTSAVYVLGHTAQFVPPPSPPSPATGNSREPCAPMEELSLDEDPAVAAADAPAAPTVDASPTSPPGTEPDSPALSPCVLSTHHSSYSLASYASSSADLSASDAVGADSLMSSMVTISAATSTSTVPAASADKTDNTASRLAGAVHVLATEATALQSVAQLYATSPSARDGFDQAVDAIVRTQTTHPPGKLVVVGVGKSGHIARKLVATFNSLAVPASFMHPTEALHGDLGHIRAHDALLFITYSGKSQELVALLPHIDPALALIVLTGRTAPETCELVRRRGASAHGKTKTILLPAPIPVEEKVAFGVAAPTASTTTALAVGDALAIVACKELHPSTESVFRRNHPGGAIGDAFKEQPQPSGSLSLSLSSLALLPPVETVRRLAVPWSEIPVVQGTDCADVLRAGYSSANGWVRIVYQDAASGCDAEFVAPPTRIRGLLSADLVRPVHEVGSRLVVGRGDLVSIAVDTKLSKAIEWVRTATAAEASEAGLQKDGDTVVAVMEYGEIIGVLELQDLLEAELRA